jgi:hypothetical protein
MKRLDGVYRVEWVDHGGEGVIERGGTAFVGAEVVERGICRSGSDGVTHVGYLNWVQRSVKDHSIDSEQAGIKTGFECHMTMKETVTQI